MELELKKATQHKRQLCTDESWQRRAEAKCKPGPSDAWQSGIGRFDGQLQGNHAGSDKHEKTEHSGIPGKLQADRFTPVDESRNSDKRQLQSAVGREPIDLEKSQS